MRVSVSEHFTAKRVFIYDLILRIGYFTKTIIYTSLPFREWFKDSAYSRSTMNLFRSEEHIRHWSGFKPGTEEGIIPLLDMAKAFSVNFVTRRLDKDYVSHMQEYMMKGVTDRGCLSFAS